MPLVIVLFIGILAFGLFDLTLGRPLPVSAPLHSTQEPVNRPTESVDVLSIKTVATSQVAHCEPHDTACQLLALYHFVVATVMPEAKQHPWLPVPRHPARTLSLKTGDAADIAVLLSSLLDQQRIRNYLIMLPNDSYVLACDISLTALHRASGNWPPATSAFDPYQITPTDDPTAIQAPESIDAYAVNVDDAPCPCVLLDPSAPSNQQPGRPLPLHTDGFRYAIDLNGQRHRLVHSGS
jgi:hypothetical protein